MGYAEDAVDEMFELAVRSRGKSIDSVNRGAKGELPALHMLAVSSTPLTPGRMSDTLGVSPGRVSAILDRLEKKGMVVRETDPSNRRNVLVSITDKGREVDHQSFTEIHNRFVRVFERMGEEHTRQFLDRCREFAGYMRDEGLPEPPEGPPCAI
ncbi:MarR family winged helix-turn-helix transcriptional regulator [Bifidobacterium simiarum]|uniref:MarR family transcriptional regulator n=1 Tax=Bifidobacterium simiarum TaxID=2045441 RepID=A0A2M9HGB8_9BIFI|nr:MarR family transcriptional regulator [Bifidobacterium simiarum]MBT1167043.1 MarR family transcriptional regulator [Bifidobacterium simiarum]PJM75856.1 MarR family transcriptional regulator [Bifidobacterium simiarum]